MVGTCRPRRSPDLSPPGSIIIRMPALTGPDTPAVLPPSPDGNVILTELESARDLIARRLIENNHAIPDPDLNYAAVSALLQALFLKSGEECGFVEPGTVAILAACDGIAARMGRACADAGLDPAVLFDKGPDEKRVFPIVPDEPLCKFLSRIDQQDFPVPVARLPLEECAVVLDYFLGTRVQAAEGCRVKHSGKSALLYTGSVDVPPQKLVDAIVEETLRPAIRVDGRANRQERRVLDMACGAGLFLLAAFHYLSRSQTRSTASAEGAGGTACGHAAGQVFGTDIDPESVSAARFVLLLAFIEEYRLSGRGPVSPEILREAACSLSRSVRCGNALIAPDYFTGKPVFPFNAEERRRVNPFDWQEAFPDIAAAGGFDTVIGAPPPYRPFAVQAREEYFQTHYGAYAPSAGLYGYFIERGISLLRPGGNLGVLVPGTFLRSQHARPLRRLILTRRIVAISSTGRTRGLSKSDVPEYFLQLRNEPPSGSFVVSTGMSGSGPEPGTAGVRSFTLSQHALGDGGWRLEDTRAADLLSKILAAGTPLEHYVLGEVYSGTCRVKDNPLVTDTKTRNRLTKGAWWCRRFFVPLLRTADIRRWLPAKPDRFLICADNPRQIRTCRALAAYLEPAAADTDTGSENEEIGGKLSALSCIPSPLEVGQKIPKIVFSIYQQRPAFSYDATGSFALTASLASIHRNDRFILGLLNSSLGQFVIMRTCPLTDRGYHISPAGIGKFPVMTPDFDKLPDKIRYDKMVALVTQILELNRYLAQAKTDQERRSVQQEIDALEVRIDALVYELYGLNPEEIAIIERDA